MVISGVSLQRSSTRTYHTTPVYVKILRFPDNHICRPCELNLLHFRKFSPIMSSYSGPSISAHVKIVVAPSNIEPFLVLFKSAYDIIIAAPENVFFELYQNSAVPGEFKWVENWNASPEWLQVCTPSYNQ